MDGETGGKVQRRDLVKGHEFKKDHYLLLTDEDFESVRVPSSTTMTVETFVPADTLDPIYYDASCYLVPDGDAGDDVYGVLRDAIAASGKVALTHVVMAQRERAWRSCRAAGDLRGDLTIAEPERLGRHRSELMQAAAIASQHDEAIRVAAG